MTTAPGLCPATHVPEVPCGTCGLDQRASQVVVTVTPTIMSGTVIRWYRGLPAAQNGREMVSASREGVLVLCFLHEIPPGVLDAASAAHAALKADRGAALGHLATHRHEGFGRPLVPVAARRSPPG